MKITSNAALPSGGFGKVTARDASCWKNSASIASGALGAAPGAAVLVVEAPVSVVGRGGASTSTRTTIAATTRRSRRTKRAAATYAASATASAASTVQLTKRPASSRRYAPLKLERSPACDTTREIPGSQES